MDTYTGNLEVAPETTPTPTPTPPPGYLFYDPNEYRGTATAWRAVTSTTIQEDAYVEIGGDVRQIYEDGYVAYLGYRKNNGGWIEIGRNTTSSYITVCKNDSVNEGDTIDFGLKWGGTGGNALGKNLYIKIASTPTPTPTPTPTLTPTPTPCNVSTDKDEYYQGDTVTISYKNAPANSTLVICAYPVAKPSRTWTVSGTDSKTYTIPKDAPTGTWQVSLFGTGCSKTKFITVLHSPTPTPTPPSITGECVFPRLITGTLTPRLDNGVILYRVRCIIDKWSGAIHT